MRARSFKFLGFETCGDHSIPTWTEVDEIDEMEPGDFIQYYEVEEIYIGGFIRSCGYDVPDVIRREKLIREEWKEGLDHECYICKRRHDVSHRCWIGVGGEEDNNDVS